MMDDLMIMLGMMVGRFVFNYICCFVWTFDDFLFC